MTAIVYTGEGCTACREAVVWLKAQGIEVEERNFTCSPVPVYGLPVIAFGGEYIYGFNKTRIREITGRCSR